MKIRTYILAIITAIIIIAIWPKKASGQQYKLRQVTSMMNMKSETTIYVKGMRKRTEGGGYAGMNNNPTTIEQCDLQRTISLNDKKKLYYIEPFTKETERIVYEDEKSSTKTKPIATAVSAGSTKGGIVTMWYNVTDTGERKKMYGMTARHVWSTQRIIPSADACMKDSMTIKTDGWYIDLPQFNCPVRYTAAYAGGPGTTGACNDKYVTRQSGKGKTGFPLIEKRTMITGNGTIQTSIYETNLETIEFSTAHQDSMLFEIPTGYTLTKDINDLYERMDAASIAEHYGKANRDEGIKTNSGVEPKKSGTIRIGILEPSTEGALPASELQQHLVASFNAYNVEAVAVSSADQAKETNCNFILRSNISRAKQASRVGGFLKAVRNVDPFAVSSYNVEVQFVLLDVVNGTTRSEKKLSGKFEGTTSGAAKKAMEEGSAIILKDLK